ncbi:MAG: hypothetical protein CGW95_13680 [Phenylobacterium zucineum]|nr:MAG: hypothetical protein CGW95_13680 [Phenylobacterium zucineum]
MADLFVISPFIIGGAFALMVLVAAFRPDTIRLSPVLVAVTAGVCGAGLAYLHFADLIPLMRSTAYPGERLFNGGGVQGLQVLAHVFPYLVTARYEPLSLWPTNFCEIAVVGTFLPLAMACFCRIPETVGGSGWIRANGPGLLVWFSAVILLLVWLLVPVSGSFFPILNQVAPGRMLWGFGLLFFLVFALLGPA